MSTHSVTALDTARLLQCVGILLFAFAAITSFDPFYWLTYTLPLALIGGMLLLAPLSVKFKEFVQGKQPPSWYLEWQSY